MMEKGVQGADTSILFGMHRKDKRNSNVAKSQDPRNRETSDRMHLCRKIMGGADGSRKWRTGACECHL